MKIFSISLAAFCFTVSIHAANIFWTNTLGGSWHGAANWSPNTVPSSSDLAYVTNAGSYNIVITNNASSAALLIGAGNVIIDNYATLWCSSMVVTNGGTMTWSNSWINGALTLQSGAQLFCSPPNFATIYSLTLTNNGTVTWNSGSIGIGGTPATFVMNNGLWIDSSSGNIGTGGGAQTVFVNNGIFRKTGSSASSVNDFNFFNNNLIDVQGGTLNFRGGTTNLLTGSYTTAASATLQFIAGTYSDAGGIFSGVGTARFNATALNLRTNAPPGLSLYGGDIWILGANTFQGTGSITNLAIDGATLRGTNTVTGTLNFSSGSIPEELFIASNAVFNVTTSGLNKNFYGATIINQGTVNFGAMTSIGGTTISNGGVWNVTGDNNISYGGGAIPSWINAGVLRKTAGTGLCGIGANFLNLPGALVDAQSGSFVFQLAGNGQLGGTFNATGNIYFNSGTWTDAGGVATGAGTVQLNGATLNLQTNIIPGMLLAGGTVNITGTNTFQNAGAITNLTLNGATLAGNYSVSGGTLTMNSGAISGQLTVQTNGQLFIASNYGKYIAPLVLTNLGMVTVNGGNLGSGNTAIYNFGLWQMTGDFGLGYGGVGTMAFTNFGTFRKTTGSGNSDCTPIRFFNQPGALVQVDAGTLLLPTSATNLFGTLRLNGGTFGYNFVVAGGTLDGTGNFNPNNFSGGTISPGVGGAARMNFANGLNLNSNVIVTFDGNGPVPGVSYDTLSVTGAVSLANANLQITAMPTVPAGTKFTLIDNDGTDAVTGTFAGLPENSVVTVGAQDFRIHYAGGTGNDVTLVRDGVVTGPALVMQGYATNAWTFTGSNAIPLIAYTVRASTNLITWTNIGVVTSSVNGTWTFTDTNAWRYARRFYNTTN